MHSDTPAHPFPLSRRTFRAVAEAFVPETADAGPDAWNAVERLVAEALAARPPAVRRQVALFLRVLDLAALLQTGRPLRRLDPARRATLIERIGRSRLLALRRGVWGLRTLVFLGWYGQDTIQRAIGYRAHPAGWDAR